MKSGQKICLGAIVVLFSVSLFVSACAETPSYYESNKFYEISVARGEEDFVLKEFLSMTISTEDALSLEEIEAAIEKSREKQSKKIVSSVRFFLENRRYFEIVYFLENEPGIFYQTTLLFAIKPFNDELFLFPVNNGKSFSLSIPTSRMDDAIVKLLAPEA